MSRLKTQICGVTLLALLALTSANADISNKQARQAITKTVGMALSSSAVRVTSVSSSSNTSAEASAELELVFRVTRDDKGLWRLREVRSGDARWDDVALLAQAAKLNQDDEACHSKGESDKYKSESSLNVIRARCLVANFFSISLPSDAIRIKSVSPLSLGSQPSALAISLVQADFRLTRDSSGWRVVELRTGSRGWVNVDTVPSTIDSLKRAKTTDDMETIARALDQYRQERGTFVVSDKHSVLIDHLNPRFLNRVMRLDQWQRPLRYQGTSDHFTLRSLGPDGKDNTTDDIVVSR
jgi:hypothetical protein